MTKLPHTIFDISGGGPETAQYALTLYNINETIPLLASLLPSPTAVTDLSEFLPQHKDAYKENRLASLFSTYGSDKATTHNYYHVYSRINEEVGGIKNILEIGLGTNNPSFISNMGVNGKPGASLRAFRDFLSETSHIYGADVDREILFTEARIDTSFVDQTEPSTIDALLDQLPPLDLIIDDGLHASATNLATLKSSLPRIRVGGWIVIEDISENIKPLWKVVATLLPNFTTYILRTKAALIFAARRDA